MTVLQLHGHFQLHLQEMQVNYLRHALEIHGDKANCIV